MFSAFAPSLTALEMPLGLDPIEKDPPGMVTISGQSAQSR
jgi:hypothetical protein